MMRRLSLIALALTGTILIALGVSWKWLRPPEAYWSQKQAQQYVDAFVAVHAAEDGLGADGAPTTDLIAARQKYDSLKDELDLARTARDRTGNYFSYAGLALLLSACVLWHFYAPTSDEKTT
jgi:hypothetical protein